ncbi:uncharacterized protein LOC131225543 [Magnolia sinica]|uniref:uncharacterized protein LOC131225543 n=1 Tax=Magnolia sinica TaxID=86752 RepID=UPI002657E7A2|nr:uncharacterized protein LOC131225543 [Magnolia sinica]
MEKKLENPSDGGNQPFQLELENPNNGGSLPPLPTSPFNDEIDSSCSTPYVSAPSSPGRNPNCYYFSAPASPMHFALSGMDINPSASSSISTVEFEFSARFPPSSSATVGSMISADELFLNGKIRPMKLSSHLQRPQNLAPLLDLDHEEDEEEKEANQRGREIKLRNRSVHRRARSLSPMRNAPQFEWHEDEEEAQNERETKDLDFKDPEQKQAESSVETTPSVSASSSRSSSSGRSSKRWIFLKDLLYRSKSEGRANAKEKFWHSISFSPSKEKKSPVSASASPTSLFYSFKEKKTCQSTPAAPATEARKEKRGSQIPAKPAAAVKPTNGVGKRRVPPSPHELHYTANRAQAEELRKKTFLPYRQGLLGCLGFSSKGYGAMTGFAKTLNTVSSR